MFRLGRYEVVSEIGRGGMGIVYRGLDTALGRPVAIKTISLTPQTTPEETRQLRTRLKREAQAAATFSHPNIVAIFDVGQEGEDTYVVMELVEGGTLERALYGGGEPPSQTTLLEILEAVAQALDYAHAHGVVHRDVKPANIFIEESGRIKLGDFGIARVAGNQTITETGMLTGSPHYMSPEQLKGEPATGRSDQFALAVVAYTVLVGRKPFDSDSFAALASKILFEEPQPPAAFGRQVPPGVERVLRRGMAKTASERYASCGEFMEALTRECRAPGAAAEVVRPEPVRALRRWLLPAFVVASVLVVATFLVWLVARERATRTEPVANTAQGTEPAAPTAAAKPPSSAAAPAASPSGPPAVPAEKAVEAPPRLPAPRPAALNERVNPKDGLAYVEVPPGSFQMGCLPEDPCDCCSKPSHAVTLSHGFRIGRTPATVESYQRFSRETGTVMPPEPTGWGNCFKDGNGKNPICNVTWKEAGTFCKNSGGRLPTEAEWEYAARAGWTTTARSSRELAAPYSKLGEVAWLDLPPHPVGQRAPNALGLHDTLGLMFEWCADLFSHQYPAQALTDPVSNSDPRDDYPAHVLRGGHTEDMATMPFNSLVSLRQRGATGTGIEDTRAPGYGFRCVLPEQ